MRNVRTSLEKIVSRDFAAQTANSTSEEQYRIDRVLQSIELGKDALASWNGVPKSQKVLAEEAGRCCGNSPQHLKLQSCCETGALKARYNYGTFGSD